MSRGPGIYFDVSTEEYRALPYMNQSTLKKWMEFNDPESPCPAKFRHWQLTHEHETSTDAQLEGSLLDCLLLESSRLHEKFAIIPVDAPKRPSKTVREAKKPSPESVMAIEWWDDFEREAGKRLMVDSETYTSVSELADRFLNHDKLGKIFQVSKKAVLIAEMCGAMCKAEVDLFPESGDFLFDLKKVRSARNTERFFGKDAFKFGYHIQASFYMSMAKKLGEDRNKFGFLLGEMEEPYLMNAVCVTQSSPMVEYAKKQWTAAIYQLRDHQEKNHWPSYPLYQELNFPLWAQMEASEATE